MGRSKVQQRRSKGGTGGGRYRRRTSRAGIHRVVRRRQKGAMVGRLEGMVIAQGRQVTGTV